MGGVAAPLDAPQDTLIVAVFSRDGAAAIGVDGRRPALMSCLQGSRDLDL